MNFINWVLFHPLYSSKFIVEKVWSRFLRRGYGIIYYPPEILEILERVRKGSSVPVWMLNGKNVDSANKSSSFVDLSLAGTSIRASAGRIPWDQEFLDSEDGESLHRWNWMLTGLAANQLDTSSWIAYVVEAQNDWVDKYQHESSKEGGEVWESYNVGERIANSVIFYHLTGSRPADKLIAALSIQARGLSERMEYYDRLTGNHVCNNARALYLGGISLGIDGLSSLARGVFQRELAHLVTEDGFLREGSSHYQFLFTRWILEVRYFAQLGGDLSFVNWLEPIGSRLLCGCLFFLQQDSHNNWSLPLFGDISPDFTPQWLIDLPWSRLANGYPLPTDEPPSVSGGSIASLWGTRKEKYPLEYTQKDISFPQSGWFRLQEGQDVMYSRLDKISPSDYVGHHHQDLFHFVAFRHGVPILIDSGRLNYLFDDKMGRFGVTSAAHNSVLVGDNGPWLLPASRYPKEFSRVRNEGRLHHDVLRLRSTAFHNQGVEMERSLLMEESAWKVLDHVRTRKSHQFRFFFHFSPLVEISLVDLGEVMLALNGEKALLTFKAKGHLEVLLHNGGEDVLGWAVVRYGVKVASPTLEVRWKAPLSGCLESHFNWNPQLN